LVVPDPKAVDSKAGDGKTGDGKVSDTKASDAKAGESKAPDNMKVNFTRYLKVDGQVEIPVGATLKTFQLRVLERGAVRAQQSISR
jgi:hypothetical protein